MTHQFGEQPVSTQLVRTKIDSITEYQELAMRTLAENVKNNDVGIFSDYRAAMHWNAASGIASEAGEINEIYKKVYFHGHPLNDETLLHLKKETGDLMWYVMLNCFANGWDPAEVLQVNIEKLKARYPEGFSTERSMNRAPGDI